LAFDHDWVELAAAGTVAVAVIVRRATGIAIWRAAVPFTTGLVEMEHDIRLPGRILCSCAEAPRPGSAVTLCRIRTEGGGIVHAFEHHCQSALEEAE
jgi:uncharacterized protein